MKVDGDLVGGYGRNRALPIPVDRLRLLRGMVCAARHDLQRAWV